MSKLTARERERPVSRDTGGAVPHAIGVRSGQGRCHGGGVPGASPLHGRRGKIKFKQEHQGECIKINKQYWYLPPGYYKHSCLIPLAFLSLARDHGHCSGWGGREEQCLGQQLFTSTLRILMEEGVLEAVAPAVVAKLLLRSGLLGPQDHTLAGATSFGNCSFQEAKDKI